MNNQVTPVSGKKYSVCSCGLPPLPPGKVHDLLQEWMADHPYHTRKEHVFAWSIFAWLERRPSGVRE